MTDASDGPVLRAALYLRVSTARQAEHDVSIPDQRRQGEAWCVARGYELVETFVDAGVSATSDRRPEFQRLIEAASERPSPFDVIVTHSFSRFFRDHFELEFHIRKLARNGVKLVSITQAVGDDPTQVMMRRIMTLFDEYQSRENGKHTLRARKENARQGFWNGSLPPIGYRVVEAEKRGSMVKKTLAVDPMHAETVRLIYRLALNGDGVSGPMGLKRLVKYLNERKIFTRDGGRWGVGQIHKVLTRTTYVGRHQFNTHGKGKALKPEEEVITVPVPPLIDQATFDAVQAHLRARNPKVRAPRLVISPNMLTGLLRCAQCGGLMTIRTGGAGRYRYYACQSKPRRGTSACTGRAVPMETLDALIAKHMMARLLDRERLALILDGILQRRRERLTRDGGERLGEFSQRADDVRQRLKRLLKAIEEKHISGDEPALQERLAYLRALQIRTDEGIKRIRDGLERANAQAVTPSLLCKFAETAQQRIMKKGNGFRRSYTHAVVNKIVVEAAQARIVNVL